MKIYIVEQMDWDDYSRIAVFLVPDDFDEKDISREMRERRPNIFSHCSTETQLKLEMEVLKDRGYEQMKVIGDE